MSVIGDKLAQALDAAHSATTTYADYKRRLAAGGYANGGANTKWGTFDRLIAEAKALADPVTPPAPSDVASKIGVFLGNDKASRLPLYDQWLGKPAKAVLDFGAGNTDVVAPSWTLDPYKNSGKRPIISIPMPDAMTLQDLVNGKWDSQLVAGGQRLATANAIARPLWEFNGSWERWCATPDPALFISAWQHIVTKLKEGGNVPVLWCPSRGINAIHWNKAWPGTSYVDYVGCDVYDEEWSVVPDPAARWNIIYNGTAGVKDLMDFSRTSNKKFIFGEWGVIEPRSNGTAGGDNPDFIQRMIDLIKDPIVEYAMYFDIQASDGYHALSRVTINNTASDNPALAQSAAKYRSLINA